IQPEPAVRFVEAFARAGHVAKRPARLDPGPCLGHPELCQTFDFELDVTVDFRAEIVERAPATEHGITPAAGPRGSSQRLWRGGSPCRSLGAGACGPARSGGRSARADCSTRSPICP